MARPRVSIEERFMKQVSILSDEDCWLYKGIPLTRYGTIGLGGKGGKRIGAHRFSYEWHYGPLPKRMNVCHHCDTPSCCNPHHLFIGTHQDNSLDMYSKGRGPASKAHCPNGHLYEGNTGWAIQWGKKMRLCILCRRQRNARYKKKLKSGR